jgi:ribose/xylose/arabinose/galactoside ABC-type transport system permease subunit
MYTRQASQWARLLANPNVIRLLILVLLIAGFGVATNGVTLGINNLTTVLVQSAIRGIAACGQALVILTAGLDLSVSGIVTVCLMLGGSLVTGNPAFSLLGSPISPLLALPIVLLVGTGFGLTNGFLVARFNLPSLLVTLAMWQICIGLAYQVTGSGFVDQIPSSIAAFGQAKVAFIPVPILIFLGVFAVCHFLLHHTRFGSEIYAVGGNPRTAFLSGVKVRQVRVAVFGLAGLLYGIGAVVSMSHYSSSTMAQATGLELSTIAAVAIGGVSLAGGKGTILGVLLGVLMIAVIDNGLSVLGVGPAGQALAKGIIIIVVVFVGELSWSSIRWTRQFQR